MTFTSSKGSALVTGAGQGIGRGIALRLAEDGFDVAINDIDTNAEAAQRVVEEVVSMGRRGILVLGDVSREENVKEMVATAATELGQLNVMIANAGVCRTGTISQTSVAEFDWMMSVNARGVFLCYKYAAEQMIKQGGGGRIIAACSVAGKRGSPNLAAYSASKFVVRSLTQSAAQEYGKYNITVNAYAPGAVETSMLMGIDEELSKTNGEPRGSFSEKVKNMRPLQRNGTPEDIAALVSYLVSDQAAFVTGQSINIEGGMWFD